MPLTQGRFSVLREIVLFSSEMMNISVCWDNKNSGFDSAHRTVPCVIVSKRYIESNKQDGGRFSVLVRKVVISQRKSINNFKSGAKNTQDIEPSPVLCVARNSSVFFEND